MSLTSTQRTTLKRRRVQAIWGIILFLCDFGAMGWLVALKIGKPELGARGPFWLMMGFGLFWLVISGRSWLRLFRIRRDLQEKTIESCECEVEQRMHATPGLIRFNRYSIRCGERIFTIPQSEFFRLRSGGWYRIQFGRHSGVYLGAEPLRGGGSTTAEPVGGGDAPELLDREMEVLELIAAGLSNQEIADRLFLSINTIKMYTSQLYRKLDVRRRTAAVKKARRLGILPQGRA